MPQDKQPIKETNAIKALKVHEKKNSCFGFSYSNKQIKCCRQNWEIVLNVPFMLRAAYGVQDQELGVASRGADGMPATTSREWSYDHKKLNSTTSSECVMGLSLRWYHIPFDTLISVWWNPEKGNRIMCTQNLTGSKKCKVINVS